MNDQAGHDETGQATAVAVQKRRLKFRAWHRGIKEMDLILGHFADTHVDGMSEEQLAAFEALLEEPDTMLYNWISGREEVPEEQRSPLLEQIMQLDFMPQAQ